MNTTYNISKWWFGLVVLTFMVQYIQPEEIINALTPLRPHLLCVAILALMLFFSKHDMFQLKYPQMKIFWMFTGVIAVLSPFGVVDGQSSFVMLQFMIAFGVFMSALLVAVNSPERLKNFITVMMVVTGYIVIRGFISRQPLGGNEFMFAFDEATAANYFSNPNDLAMFVVMMIPFIYFSLLNKQEFWGKALHTILLLSSIALVILTFSRGGFLGLIVTLVACTWYSRKTIGVQKVIVMGVVLGLLLSFFIGKAIIDSWMGEMSTTSSLDQGTSHTRLELWKTSFEIFLDNPMGIGAGSTPYYMREYSNGDLNNVSHSIWFSTLVEEGVIGIILLTSLLWMNFKNTFLYNNIKDRYLSNFVAACNVSLLSFIVTGTFGSKMHYPHIWYLTALIIIGTSILAKYKQGNGGKDA